MKIPRLLHPFFWLFFLLLLFHELYKHKFLENTSTINTPSSLLGHQTLINHRKALAANFDFTPFLHHRKIPPEPPGGREIDPLYGVEKRLVPTGPNPLHH
ncbi:hypothetical protein ACS0TY_008275 [Phlomoides rotata]